MKIKVEREIERISKFERKWKIKTSKEKFKIIPVAQLKTKKIKVKWQRNRNKYFRKTPWIKYNFNWVRWPFKKNDK